MGDVTGTSDGDVYGDGVNVAARLQEQAEPSAVLVSEAVWQQLRARRELRFEPRGERTLKGLPEPLPVYEARVREAGEPRADPPPRGGSTRPTGSRLPRAMTTGALALVVAIVLFIGAEFGWFGRASVGAADVPDQSIAVLPFANLSDDRENEYFSDGITEDILTQLSKIPDLSVISRTSAMQYKGTTKGLRTVGEELGVAHILEGSVRRAGERLRVTAQLIHARTDQHIWAETYDRELTDVFAIQSEIAQQIARALQARLTRDVRERIEARPTTDLTAYDLYLQGRDFYYRYTREENEQAIRLFRQAVELDPRFALAYAGLGDAFALATNRYGQPIEWADSGVVAAERAIELDPRLAEAHKALGTALLTLGRHRRARDALSRAVALNPGNAPAVANLGIVEFLTGRFDEAMRLQRQAATLNPALRAGNLANMANFYVILGLFEQSATAERQALTLHPDHPMALQARVFRLLVGGDAERAVSEVERLVATQPGTPRVWFTAGHAWIARGDAAEAARRFERMYELAPTPAFEDWGRSGMVSFAHALWQTGARRRAEGLFTEYERYAHREIERGSESPVLPYSLCILHATRGETGAALRWLERAVENGWADYIELNRDPMLASLHAESRFAELVQQNRARIERMAERVRREGW